MSNNGKNQYNMQSVSSKYSPMVNKLLSYANNAIAKFKQGSDYTGMLNSIYAAIDSYRDASIGAIRYDIYKFLYGVSTNNKSIAKSVTMPDITITPIHAHTIAYERRYEFKTVGDMEVYLNHLIDLTRCFEKDLCKQRNSIMKMDVKMISRLTAKTPSITLNGNVYHNTSRQYYKDIAKALVSDT